MKVAICLIATGKYSRFVAPLIASIEQHFMTKHERKCVLFTDVRYSHPLVHVHSVGHVPWPYPTLHRYHIMLRERNLLLENDYVYYLDVDMRLVDSVDEQIFGELIATIHPSFFRSPREKMTFENRPQSRAYVPPHEGKQYYAGAFQGGSATRYVAAMESLAAAVDDDHRRDIIALWHDESHWNRYLINNPPSLTLSHEYCCPARWQMEARKIIIVRKNGREMRK